MCLMHTKIREKTVRSTLKERAGVVEKDRPGQKSLKIKNALNQLSNIPDEDTPPVEIDQIRLLQIIEYRGYGLA